MLTTSVERLEGNRVKLTVTIPAADVDAAIENAYKVMGAKVRLPGFRPGKAPKAMLDGVVGQPNIHAEATEEVVNTTYPRALDAEKLRPIEPPVMDELDTVAPGEDYTYVAEIDVRPELTLSSTDGLVVELPPREATDADIQLQIELAQERFATLEPVEDRGIEADDFVLLSFTGTVDGEDYEGNVVDKYLFEMGRGLMPPEFDKGLLGAKAGDEVHVEFLIEEGTANEDFAGKTAAFDISVHEIKAKKLPELNDEFATNAGGFDSYDEMVEDVRTRINAQKGVSWEQLKERSARKALADRLEGDIPDPMVASRKNQMERDFAGMLEQRGMSIEDYLAQSGIDFEQFSADMDEQAKDSIREELALEALFRQLDFEVTESDIEEEIKTVSQQTEETPEAARERWESLGLMSVIHEQIMHRKASLWMLDNLEVIERAEEPETESADEAAPAESDAAAKE